MKTNVVSLSFFKGENGLFSRLDAEYADPDLVSEENILKKTLAARKIGELCAGSIVNSLPDSRRVGTEKATYISIDSIDTDDGAIYPAEVAQKDLPSRAKYLVKAGDVLVSNVRPNRGAISIIPEGLVEGIASSGFTVCRLPEGEALPPEFLFAFLKTDFGRRQLMRRNRGSMYPAVLGRDVLDVSVPSPDHEFEKTIVALVHKSLKAQAEFFKKSDNQAKKLTGFLSTLAPPPPSPLETRRDSADWTSVSSKDMFGKGAARFDAEFFRQEYADFETAIESASSVSPLGDHFTLQAGRSPGTVNGVLAYVKQGALTNFGVNWTAVEWVDGDAGQVRGRVQDGDILLACTAHEVYYVGRKVDYVRSVPNSMIGANACVADLIVIRPKPECSPELYGSYVAAFLRSPWGLHQVQRCIRGLRGGHVYGSDLARYVKIPVPPDEWLREFESIAAAAEAAKLEAKAQMNEAFLKIDQWLKNTIANA